MIVRIISGIGVVVVVVGVLLFSNTIVLNIAVAALSVACVYEALIATKYVESHALMFASLGIAALTPFVMGFSKSTVMLLMFVYVVIMFLLVFKNFETFKLEHIGVVFLISVIIPYFFGNIIFLNHMDHGIYYLYLIFIGSWCSDSIALCAGKLFGRHKLIPKVSPKKTVEGAIGGIVGTMAGYAVTGVVVERCFELQVNFLALLLLAVGVSIIGQVGDLAASTIKRSFQIKDFGNVIPGHGGVFDRFDSVLFIAPFIALFAQFFTIFL
ncbi:phosphatidate cytidylyltransferase [Feifania hominis]|uniref:Phosphatidate cytidylyltransferase n=1 Tax=Feifania hominis TaxID=2763660 RepID=A0A926DD52_9FIRM|nr:phosphatidate cytidylyltransferase [Feifania hominis]